MSPTTYLPDLPCRQQKPAPTPGVDWTMARWGHVIGISLVLSGLLLFSALPLPVRAQSSTIPLVFHTSTAETDFTTSMDWGDFDNDGDLDLIVGNGMIIREDAQQAIRMLPFWLQLIVQNSPMITELIERVAIADNRHNRLYCNEGGVLVACWESKENDFTTDVAWGDMDNDGDLDLAVANTGLGVVLPVIGELIHETPNRIYRNLGLDSEGHPRFELVCCMDLGSSVGIAWGDYDDDGDLDLATANGRHFMKVTFGTAERLTHDAHPVANRIYRNNWLPGGAAEPFSLDPTFKPEPGISFRAEWVDVDRDGMLDLAFANQGTDRVYCNRKLANGPRIMKLCWESPAPSDLTTGMSWGDVDNDGDPDLAVGNSELWSGGEPNRLYRNKGLTSADRLDMEVIWQSRRELNDASLSVAWGDVNNDGLLDLAVGNGNFDANQKSYVYCGNGDTLGADPCWSSPYADISTSIAWGDFDSDGDADLAVGNISVPVGQNNRFYRNDSVPLESAVTTWTAGFEGVALSVAWGDADRDGDLDLMVGNSGETTANGQAQTGRLNYLYLNDNGVLTETHRITFTQIDNTHAVAWGDADNDGDLDLMVGNARNSQLADAAAAAEPSFFYCNQIVETGSLLFTLAWTVNEPIDVNSVAWGDIDGDGDLDLAFGNGGRALDLPVAQSNRVYRNDGVDCAADQATFTQVWQAEEVAATQSVAWGDVDNDGDLDLAVGNSAGYSRLYRNDGPDLHDRDPRNLHRFVSMWDPVNADDTHSVAWGDMNGDGFLDLVLGNTTQANRVYCNENGRLAATECWRSSEAERTRSVAWGDVDGDGDLDLAVGNQEAPNQLYLNLGGALAPAAAWLADATGFTWSIAWGDVDNDGDLDLASGNPDWRRPGLFQNLRHRPGSFSDLLPSVVITRPGGTPAATGFATPVIIQATEVISIHYKLFGANSVGTVQIFPEFSPNGGGQWFPATAGLGGDGAQGLAASAWPTGTAHVFVWQAAHDLIKNDQVVFRLRTQTGRVGLAPPPTGSQSLPFRYEAPWFISVRNEDQQPEMAAALYAAGQLITYTNRAGLVGAVNFTQWSDLPIVALAPQHGQRSARAAHRDDLVYTIHTSTQTRNAAGEPQPFMTKPTGEQALTLRRQEPLVLFNLVVSIEWPANITETQIIARGLYSASTYLYDLTDGQMAFGHVDIYDRKRHWEDADIQFEALNRVRPHARIGGILSQVEGSVIQLGRAWDGNQGAHGPWDQPNGYRTIVHEFGHYALHLYDEYLVPIFAPGNPKEVIDLLEIGRCVRKVNNGAGGTPVLASAMYDQYNTSELSDQGLLGLLWAPPCEETAQWLLSALEQGAARSAWDAVVFYYSDPQRTDPRWELLKPSARSPQQVIIGPTRLLTGLPDWPTTTLSFSERTGAHRQLTVVDEQNQPLANTSVAMLKADGQMRIEQGVTNDTGQIELYGAETGDRVDARYAKADLFGSVVLGTEATLTLQLTSQHAPEP